MNTSHIYEIFKIAIPVINRWNNRFYYQSDFLDTDNKSLYNLVTVGGVAYNAHMPPHLKSETNDLDLKLVYNKKIEPNDFYSTFVKQFNPLRTRIMLEIKKQVNLYINQLPELTSSLIEFTSNEFVSLGIAYKYPYLIYNNQDARNSARLYPKMVNMVYSLLYHSKGETTRKSLIDLSMFININNPDYLYGKTIDVKLYNEYYDLNNKMQTNTIIPYTNIGLSLPGASIGFIISDLYWMTHLHHREDQKIAFNNKLEKLLDYLETLSRENLSHIVSEIKQLIKIKPEECDSQYLLDCLHNLNELQNAKFIPKTFYFLFNSYYPSIL